MILPFGTAAKWDLDNIKLRYTSTAGLHFQTEVPVVYIDKSQNQPLMACEAYDMFGPKTWDGLEDDDDYEAGLNRLRETVKAYMPESTTQEHRFVDGYFDFMIERISWAARHDNKARQRWWSVLIPIPQAQLYCEDPMEKGYSPDPKHNFRIDFAFWTGDQIVGVEIDGWEPQGYSADVRRNRLLRRAGVDLIHVMNREVEKSCEDVIRKLLPDEISTPWRHHSEKATMPFIPF